MSDNTGGLSGMAGFALGRMSAENDRVLIEAASAFKRRGKTDETVTLAEYNDLLEENARLRRNLAIAREDFRKLAAVYDTLDEWANAASATMKHHGLIRG